MFLEEKETKNRGDTCLLLRRPLPHVIASLSAHRICGNMSKLSIFFKFKFFVWINESVLS